MEMVELKGFQKDPKFFLLLSVPAGLVNENTFSS